MYTFMTRCEKGEKRTFMKRIPSGEKMNFMKNNESGDEILLVNNIQQETDIQINNNLKSNSDDSILQVSVPVKYKYLISNNRININNAICYEDHNYGVKLLIDKKEILLTNFIIQAEKKQIKDDVIHKETLYVLQCRLVGQFGISKIIKMHSKDIINSDWIKRLGIEYSIYDNQLYKYLEIYIGRLFTNKQTEIKYEHVGWRLINNKWIYLHGGGNIGGSNFNIKGKEDKILEVDHKMNKKQALNQALNMLQIADYHKTIPMFLYTHLSVLKELFNVAGVNPNFLLWLEGLTGSRKTSTAKVFFNIFNRSKDYLSATFKDTIGSLEEKSFQYKDSLLILDDFFHSISKQEWNYTQQVASEMIRRYGDNFGKSRLDRNMERGKEYPPRGMLVITGELTIKGESTVSRYLSIGIEKNDINLEVLKYHQENPKILSTHLYHFIKWVSDNSEKIIKYIRDNFRNLRNKNQGKYGHGRFSEVQAIYEIICNIFLEYAIELEIINIEKKQDIYHQWNKFIYETISIHEKANLQQDPAIMYLQALQQLICDGEIKLTFRSRHTDKNTIGYEDEENYYLSSEKTVQETIKYWRKFSIEFPATSEMLNKALDVLGIIKTKLDKGIIRRTHKISGDSRRFLIINKLKMEEVLRRID